MITEDYVSFETAKLLKEKGFNEPCRLYYDKYHGYVPIFVEDSKLTEYGYKEIIRNDQNSISDFIASAPSLYVATKWLRVNYNIHIEPRYFPMPNIYRYVIIYSPATIENVDSHPQYFSSHEEACDTAIKYCLENLI